MNWTRRPMTKWWTILALLTLCATMSAHSQQTPTPPSETPSPISTDGSAATVTVDRCEADADAELRTLTDKLTADAEATVAADAAAVERVCAPHVASASAERDRWKAEAESVIGERDLWRDVAIGAGVVAVIFAGLMVAHAL